MKTAQSKSASQTWTCRWAILGVAALIAATTGCKTNPYQKGDAAAKSLQNTAACVQAESQAVQNATDTLKDLVNNPATDLRQQFKFYNRAVDRVYVAIKDTERTTRQMEQKSSAYLQVWNQQLGAMNYEIVRNLSDERRVAVSNQVASVRRQYEATREAVLPLLAYLEDIRKALSADLTSGGLDAIKPVAQNAETNARKVQIALNQLTVELTRSGGQMMSVASAKTDSPVAAATPRPPEGEHSTGP